MIHLEEICPDNWREELMVSEEQKTFVANTQILLARAYAYREHRSCAKMIYEDKIPVGMLLYYDCESLGGYDFSQLLIDQRYQRKGYGMKAAKLVLEWMREDKKYDKVYLCYVDGNDAAKEMYTKLGFYPTGERDEDEIIMVLDLVEV